VYPPSQQSKKKIPHSGRPGASFFFFFVGRQEMASMSDDVPHPAQPVLPQQSTAAKAAQKEKESSDLGNHLLLWANDPI